MVLLCGIPTDSPFELIGDALEEKNIPFLTLSQHDYSSLYINYQFSKGKLEGELSVHNRSVDLQEITGVYNRMTDVRSVPEYRDLKPGDTLMQKTQHAHSALAAWICITDARVLNLNRAMSSNSSKPYQMMMIEEYGFKTPESLLTNQPQEVLTFKEKHGRIIYKSASGVRSIVQELKEEDIASLKKIVYCPTLFQQLVEGSNIRVHVVGEKVFAVRVNTTAVDYRYAHKYGQQTALEDFKLPKVILKKCLSLSKGLRLPLAGIDLLHTAGDEWYCFEVNPNPGFSYFEHHTGQPISEAIADYLAGN